MRVQYATTTRLRSRSWGQAPVQDTRCRGAVPRVGPKVAFKGNGCSSWGAPAEGSHPRGGRRAPRALSLSLGARRGPGKTEAVHTNDPAARCPALPPRSPGERGARGPGASAGHVPGLCVRAVPGRPSGFPARPAPGGCCGDTGVRVLSSGGGWLRFATRVRVCAVVPRSYRCVCVSAVLVSLCLSCLCLCLLCLCLSVCPACVCLSCLCLCLSCLCLCICCACVSVSDVLVCVCLPCLCLSVCRACVCPCLCLSVCCA